MSGKLRELLKMELLRNLERRSSGRGFVKNRDFCIPRLVNYKNDIRKRQPPDLDIEDADSECLVGRFCPYDRLGGLYAIADELGYIYFDFVDKKHMPEFDAMNEGIRMHDNAIFDVAWMKSRSGVLCIATASGDKTVKVTHFDDPLQHHILTDHQQSIRALCTHVDHPGFLASSGRDGNIVIYDERSYKAANVIVSAHTVPSRTRGPATVKANNKSVTALALYDSNTLISGGYTDGTVKVWDLRRTYLKSALKQPAPLHVFDVGATVTSLNIKHNLLYASCTNHSIFCFNAGTFNKTPICKFVGHDTNSAYSSYMHASLSDCGDYLASGSFDGSIYLWSTKLGRSRTDSDEKYPIAHPLARLVGHEKEVTCVQWGFVDNQPMLLSLSDDNTHRVWRPSHEFDKADVENPIEGRTEILHPLFFSKSASSQFRNCGPLQMMPNKLLKPFPSYVHHPESVVHHCSPRLPKSHTNWLTALSPQNAPVISPLSKPKARIKRSGRSDKKSSKKLKLSSPIKTYIKIQPRK
ncbi:protein lethal(2)denticleless-like [Neocloeon triangulifer]|uniref:protein lethal(2)denticleless-like n=1 Tax=Neocloeon triangulifer TaxID=2078957 RepID=UPI00286ED189|nr:protein lethal(2)denticleless-like [Neocloeon triangulifer]XP_059478086.1 protein lethal(2)denticleless-like [Neocloeon triangulifer]